MSADRWGICPQCKKNATEKRDAAIAALSKAYGKVPVDKYEQMKQELPSGDVEDETLREDWELRTDEDGLFYLSYACSCDKCGFEHIEKIEKQLRLK